MGVALVTGAALGSFIILIAASAIVIVLVLTGGPALARLLVRHRLEAIRDDCVDAVLDGWLQRDESVDHFIRSVERTARCARRVTLLRSLAMYIAIVKLQVSRAEFPTAPSYCDLNPAERKFMHGLEKRQLDALWSYLTWGSPMGWAIAPLLIAINRRVRRTAKVATPKDALPCLTRDAALCNEQSESPATVQWVNGSHHLFAPR